MNLAPSFKKVVIECADRPDILAISEDNGIRANANVEVIFRSLTERLCEEIIESDEVYGCVAWLTSIPILEALAEKDSVGIVVQKEDFLRPDSGDWRQSRQRAAYQKIKGFRRYRLGATSGYSCASEPSSGSIRCVGFVNDKKSSAFPRMHNKFLVFCRRQWFVKNWNKDIDEPCSVPKVQSPNHYTRPIPYAVWTGSFNFTYNADNSLENAVLIRSKEIADAYLSEFGTIFGLSESLNWDSPWVCPEYRIGT